ncbi:MAG: hypothetical protein IT580_24775 [Verrucomicrobiales bacterium]|nr:hypothetical protein [Verrucomicrobiales bacterium]
MLFPSQGRGAGRVRFAWLFSFTLMIRIGLGLGLLSWCANAATSPTTITGTSGVPESTGSTFDQAARRYERGEFELAAEAFERLAAEGNASPTVWFNAGNAWFKAGRMGHAVVAYRRAATLAPRDEDIRRNLDLARAKAGTTGAGGIRDWATRLTRVEWGLLAVVASWLTVGALGWRSRSASTSGWAGSLAWLTGVILAVSAAGWWMAARQSGPELGVVVAPEIAVRFGPLDESPQAFQLRDGAEVRVRDVKGEWSQVTDAQGREGWTKTRGLQRVFVRAASSGAAAG